MRRVLLFCGALATPALACSLAISTDGLAGPPLEPDASPDTSADASLDALDAADAFAGPFCDQHPDATFCADWDHDPDPTKDFTEIVLGDHEFDLSSNAVSTPHALFAMVGPSGGSATTSGRLYHELGFIPKTLHLEVDVNLCPPTDGLLEFLKIETSSAGLHQVAPGYESSDIALSLDDSSGAAISVETYDSSGGNASKGFAVPAVIPTGKWVHLALDIAFAKDPTGSVNLYLDHNPVPAETVSAYRTLSSMPSAMRVIVGAFTAGTTVTCNDLVDNLIVVGTP